MFKAKKNQLYRANIEIQEIVFTFLVGSIVLLFATFSVLCKSLFERGLSPGLVLSYILRVLCNPDPIMVYLFSGTLNLVKVSLTLEVLDDLLHSILNARIRTLDMNLWLQWFLIRS